MSNIEAENNESYLDDDEYEEVVVEEPNEGEKKRSVWRILRRILYVLCILTAIAAAIVYVVAKNAIRDGGYAEKWIADVHGDILEDVSYGEYPQQVMDVYVPRSFDPANANGAILFIHGGAWIGGGRWEQEAFAKMMAKEGYLTANMEYTLYNNDLKERKNEYSIELVLKDVRLALAKLVVKIAFVAPRVGPVDFHAKTWDVPIRDASEDPQAQSWTEDKRIETMARITSFLSGVDVSERQYLNPDDKTEAAIESISPLYDIKPGVPPIFAAYGEKDMLVPAQNYKLLKHAFSELKAKSVGEVDPDDTETQVFDLLVFPNSNHMLARDPDYTLKWRGLFLSYASRYLTVPVESNESGDGEETDGAAETKAEE